MKLIFQQLPNSPEIWKKKKNFMKLDGVRKFKKDDQFFFSVETDEADMDDIREGLKGIVLSEDYDKVFVKKTDLPHFLEEIEKKLSFENFFDEYTVTADICSLTELSQSVTSFDVTMSPDGHDRLKCIIKTGLARMMHLREDVRVSMNGHLMLYPPTAHLEFQVKKIHVLDEDTAYQEYLYHNEYDMEGEETRTKFQIKTQIGNWKKIAVIVNDLKTMEDIEDTASTKALGLEMIPYFVRFEPIPLYLCIEQINQDDQMDAIAIMRGPTRDRYAFWALNDKMICRAFIESTKPILLGIGHKSDIVLSSRYADYNANTASALVARLAYWYAASKEATYQKVPTQQNLLNTTNHAPITAFSLLKKLFSW